MCLPPPTSRCSGSSVGRCLSGSRMGREGAVGGGPYPSLDFRPRLPLSPPPSVHPGVCYHPGPVTRRGVRTRNGWCLGAPWGHELQYSSSHDPLPPQYTWTTPQHVRLIQGQGHYRSGELNWENGGCLKLSRSLPGAAWIWGPCRSPSPSLSAF